MSTGNCEKKMTFCRVEFIYRVGSMLPSAILAQRKRLSCRNIIFIGQFSGSELKLLHRIALSQRAQFVTAKDHFLCLTIE
jgi:hypothetical protein